MASEEAQNAPEPSDRRSSSRKTKGITPRRFLDDNIDLGYLPSRKNPPIESEEKAESHEQSASASEATSSSPTRKAFSRDSASRSPRRSPASHATKGKRKQRGTRARTTKKQRSEKGSGSSEKKGKEGGRGKKKTAAKSAEESAESEQESESEAASDDSVYQQEEDDGDWEESASERGEEEEKEASDSSSEVCVCVFVCHYFSPLDPTRSSPLPLATSRNSVVLPPVARAQHPLPRSRRSLRLRANKRFQRGHQRASQEALRCVCACVSG